MAGKTRQKSAANVAESASLSLNERILKECHILYTDPDNGLIRIAETVDLTLLAPRKKITILLIGNHSAGKSTFINWYIEEHIQKTGVAIETQGFTFVTSGRKRESLTGNATLHLYSHFEPLRNIEGVVDYLVTEISTSKQKKFSLVTFVDTPGLVDGDMKYPFDVNKAILWLGDLADLIFVFFDPIGQALCKRTLTLVEQLSETHADRMRFYLSKADEAGHEGDRQRVLMQIVQELCKRPGLNRTGFDMPTIYIPNSNKPSRCMNQIEEVCNDIEKTINQTVQNTLNTLEKDCENIATLIQEKLEQDREACSYNLRSWTKGILFYMLGILFLMLLGLNFLIDNVISHDIFHYLLGDHVCDAILLYLQPINRIWHEIPSAYRVYFYLVIFLLAVFFFMFAKFTSRRKPTLLRRQKRQLLENKDYVQNYSKGKKQTLYKEYLHQSVAEHDL